MKKSLLSLATVITTSSVGISLYLATLPNPTDVQKQLSNTANTIAIAGGTTMVSSRRWRDEDNSTDR